MFHESDKSVALKYFPNKIKTTEFLYSHALCLLKNRGATVFHQGNVIWPNVKDERKNELLKWGIISEVYIIIDYRRFLFSEAFYKIKMGFDLCVDNVTQLQPTWVDLSETAGNYNFSRPGAHIQLSIKVQKKNSLFCKAKYKGPAKVSF